MCTEFIGIYYVMFRNISPFLNTFFIEDIIQVLRNQGGGEGGGMAKYHTLITEGGGGLRRL